DACARAPCRNLVACVSPSLLSRGGGGCRGCGAMGRTCPRVRFAPVASGGASPRLLGYEARAEAAESKMKSRSLITGAAAAVALFAASRPARADIAIGGDFD